jgi:hypothetical protein
MVFFLLARLEKTYKCLVFYVYSDSNHNMGWNIEIIILSFLKKSLNLLLGVERSFSCGSKVIFKLNEDREVFFIFFRYSAMT